MKIAVVHDVFIEKGGAERVTVALLDMYPKADVYIPLLTEENKRLLQQHTTGEIFTSSLNHIPFLHSASVLLKPLLTLYWETLDLSRYDLVISSSHSFSAKSVLTPPHTTHVSYIHTPPRYLYTEYNETQILQNRFFKVLLSPMLSWLRVRDFIGAQRPDVLICNSRTVQARISKYYRRKSICISPPVSLAPKQATKKNASREYYVCVSRLAKQKGIDLAIHACNELGKDLVIVGVGSQESYLRSIAGTTVKFLGYVPDSQMAEVYAKAKALLYCSIEEDFGLVPVEAMSHGLPVIGYKSGGTAETVVHQKTGILFTEYTKDSLKHAIQRFEKVKVSAAACRKHAEQFSLKRFTQKMRRQIQIAMKATYAEA